jgi:hypothetical protein
MKSVKQARQSSGAKAVEVECAKAYNLTSGLIKIERLWVLVYCESLHRSNKTAADRDADVDG